MAPELIILDLYGTLVKSDKCDDVIRPGFQEFHDFYNNSFFAISTDGSTLGTTETLKETGLDKMMDFVYDEKHLNELGGKILKDLYLVCKNLGIPTERTIFIGDNHYGVDEDSAFCAGIKFIKVPQFREELPSETQRLFNSRWTEYENYKNPFNFKSLIGKI